MEISKETFLERLNNVQNLEDLRALEKDIHGLSAFLSQGSFTEAELKTIKERVSEYDPPLGEKVDYLFKKTLDSNSLFQEFQIEALKELRLEPTADLIPFLEECETKEEAKEVLQALNSLNAEQREALVEQLDAFIDLKGAVTLLELIQKAAKLSPVEISRRVPLLPIKKVQLHKHLEEMIEIPSCSRDETHMEEIIRQVRSKHLERFLIEDPTFKELLPMEKTNLLLSPSVKILLLSLSRIRMKKKAAEWSLQKVWQTEDPLRRVAASAAAYLFHTKEFESLSVQKICQMLAENPKEGIDATLKYISNEEGELGREEGIFLIEKGSRWKKSDQEISDQELTHALCYYLEARQEEKPHTRWGLLKMPKKIRIEKGTVITDQMINEIVAKGKELEEISFEETSNLQPHHIKELKKLPHLSRLNIASCSLKSEHLNEVAKLESLTSLNVARNQLGGRHAKILSSLTKLKELDISRNPLEQAGIYHLSNLENLTALDVHDCGFYHLDTDNLVNLQSLNISSNGFGFYDFKMQTSDLKNLPKLTSLGISNCSLEASQIEDLAELSNLTSLDVSRNGLNAESAKTLTKLSKLTSLDISRNKIQTEGAKALEELPNLTYLNIEGNAIEDEGVGALSALKKLKALNVANNSLTETGASYLTSLSELQILYCGKNKFKAAGAKEISSLTHLTELDISSNDIKNEGIQFVKKLSELTSLNIASNDIDDEGVSELSNLLQLKTVDLSYNPIEGKGLGSLSKLPELSHLRIAKEEAGMHSHIKYSHIYEPISTLMKLRILDIASNYADNGLHAGLYLSTLNFLTSLNIWNNYLREGIRSLIHLMNLTHIELGGVGLIYHEIQREIDKFPKLIGENRNFIGLHAIAFPQQFPPCCSPLPSS